jgi:hypothetical protein
LKKKKKKSSACKFCILWQLSGKTHHPFVCRFLCGTYGVSHHTVTFVNRQGLVTSLAWSVGIYTSCRRLVYSSLLAAVKNLGVPRLQLDGSFHHALQTGRHQQQQQGVVSPRKNERKTKKNLEKKRPDLHDSNSLLFLPFRHSSCTCASKIDLSQYDQ